MQPIESWEIVYQNLKSELERSLKNNKFGRKRKNEKNKINK